MSRVSFEDPDFQPPKDLSSEDVRAYEERIVALLRENMIPDRVDSIELDGAPKASRIVFRWTDHTGAMRVAACDLWATGYLDSDDEPKDRLGSPNDVGSAIFIDWLGGFMPEIQ